MDLNPITTPNNILTDCINGTIITQDGNEYLLQNDFGNVKIDGAQLTPGYVPVGMKEYNGIVYIISYNPVANKTEVGSFPSIEFKGSSDSKNVQCDITIDESSNILKYSEAVSLYKSGAFINNITKEELRVEANSFINIDLDTSSLPDYIKISSFIKTDTGNKWSILADNSTKMIEYSGVLYYDFKVLNSEVPVIPNFLAAVKYNPDWSKKISIQTRATENENNNAIFNLTFNTSVSYSSDVDMANFIDNYKINFVIYTVQNGSETPVNQGTISNFTATTTSFISESISKEISFSINDGKDPDSIKITLSPYLEFNDGSKFEFDQSVGEYTYDVVIEDRTDAIYAFDKYQYYLDSKENKWVVTFNTGYNPDIIDANSVEYSYDILTGTIENNIAILTSIYKNDEVSTSTSEDVVEEDSTLILIESDDPEKTINISKENLTDECIYVLQLHIEYLEKEIIDDPENEGKTKENLVPKTMDLYRFLITAKYFQDQSHSNAYIDYSTIPINVWAQNNDLININLPSEVEDIQTSNYDNINNWLVTTIRVVNPDKETTGLDGNTYFKDVKDNFYKSISQTRNLKLEKEVNLPSTGNIWKSNVTGDINIQLLEGDNVITSCDTTIESTDELSSTIDFYREKYYELYSNEISDGTKYYHRRYLYDDYCGEKLYLDGKLLREEELNSNIYEHRKDELLSDTKTTSEIRKTNLSLDIKGQHTYEDDVLRGDRSDNISVLWNISPSNANSKMAYCKGNLFGDKYEYIYINNVPAFNLLSEDTHISSQTSISYLTSYIVDALKLKENEIINFTGVNTLKNVLSKFSTLIPISIDPLWPSYIYNNTDLYSRDTKYAILVHWYHDSEKIEGSDRYSIATRLGNIRLLTINNQYLFDSLDQVNDICRNLSTIHFIYDKNKYIVSANKFRKFNIGEYKQNDIISHTINKINIDVNIKSVNLWDISSQNIRDVNFSQNINNVNSLIDIPLTNFQITNTSYRISLDKNTIYSTTIDDILFTQDEWDKLSNSVNSSILNPQLYTTYRDYDNYNLALDNNTESIVDTKVKLLNDDEMLDLVYDSAIDCVAVKFENGNAITNKVGLTASVSNIEDRHRNWQDILYISYNSPQSLGINIDDDGTINNGLTSVSPMFITSWTTLKNILTYEDTSKYNVVE